MAMVVKYYHHIYGTKLWIRCQQLKHWPKLVAATWFKIQRHLKVSRSWNKVVELKLLLCILSAFRLIFGRSYSSTIFFFEIEWPLQSCSVDVTSRLPNAHPVHPIHSITKSLTHVARFKYAGVNIEQFIREAFSRQNDLSGSFFSDLSGRFFFKF